MQRDNLDETTSIDIDVARLLSILVEHELAERDWRRIGQARLLPGKTLDTLDFTATIFEMSVESHRRKAAQNAIRPGRPPKTAANSDTNAD